MREPALSIKRGLGDTWKGQDVACHELLQSGTVRTLPVQHVGTLSEPEAISAAVHALGTGRVDLGSTLRFGSPSFSVASKPVPSVPLKASSRPRERDRWQSERPLVTDALRQAMALAQTIPALTPEQLGLHASDVRDISSGGERESSGAGDFGFWGASDAESSGVRRIESSGVRGIESSRGHEIEPLELWLDHRDRADIAATSGSTVRVSARPLWHQLPAPFVICAAATLCILSAFAVGWFGN